MVLIIFLLLLWLFAPGIFKIVIGVLIALIIFRVISS